MCTWYAKDKNLPAGTATQQEKITQNIDVSVIEHVNV